MASFEFLGVVLSVLALSVSIIYYANILQNANKTRELQLKAQEQAEKARKAQTFMQLHQTQYDKEGVETVFILHNLEWSDFDDYLEKYSALSGHVEIAAAFDSQIGYLDGIGTMVKEKLLDVDTVYNIAGRRVLMLWFKFESVVKAFRNPKWGTPDYGEHFEYLAEEMIRIREEKGLPIAFSYLIHPKSELAKENNP